MASSIRARAAESGGVTTLKALISHPMDSGFVEDSNGDVIPAHYIKVVTVTYQDKPVFVANWGPAVSKDPYLEFKFEGANKGDEVTISWVDSEGQSDSTVATIS